MNRFIYSLLWHLILPLIALRLLWRARKQPEYLQHLAERFGATPRRAACPRIWLHAVSVGETRAAEPLIKALLLRYPQHEILLTHMTPTGRAASAALFGEEARVLRSYLPYDLPWAQRLFLARSRPQLGIVMETEVWPNLMAAAEAATIPMMLLNARLSERSARGYQSFSRLTRPSFARFSSVLAQTDADAQRLRACGAAPVEVCGNLKFDVALHADQLALGAEFKRCATERPIILAASTREGEEAPLLDAFLDNATDDSLLVLVPRHPQRFDEIATLLAARRIPYTRRSAGVSPIASQARVWLGDSMGEMQAYYHMADIAIIGGSWEPLGGQNLIEACAAGKPVIIGPHTFNFSDVSERAITAAAALRCADLDEALLMASTLLTSREACTAMGAAGKYFAENSRGATDRSMEAIARFIA